MTGVNNLWLTRFWIEFTPPDGDAPWHQIWPTGKCGVTAYSLVDALELVQTHLFRDIPTPAIRKVQENVDLSSSEFDYLRSFIGAPIWRGMWYPFFGYEYWRLKVQPRQPHHLTRPPE